MKEWMTIKDLGEYLQLPESRIRLLMNQNVIPFRDAHGFLRFNKQEIDNWMMSPAVSRPENIIENSGEREPDTMDGTHQAINRAQEVYPLILTDYKYRGRSLDEYVLTATKILLGETPWNRFPDFIKNAVHKTEKLGRDYLLRNDFESIIKNFNDYLRVGCQLGLFSKEKQDDRIKRYCPTEYAIKIAMEPDVEKIKEIILECMLNIVRNNQEARPDERHAVILLWYYLKLKELGIEPSEIHFKKASDRTANFFPKIRLNFTMSLCQFLFGKDRGKEQEFFRQWEMLK